MGGSENEIALITRESAERWPRMGKEEVARRLAEKVAETLGDEGGGLKLAAE